MKKVFVHIEFAWIKLTAGHGVVVENQELEEEYDYLVFVQVCRIFDAE